MYGVFQFCSESDEEESVWSKCTKRPIINIRCVLIGVM